MVISCTVLPMAKRNRSAVVLGYLRCSTEEQAVSGLGLADQRAVIDAEAARRGWDAVEYVTDDGYSAKSLARPGIADALDRLRAGEAGVLVVSKIDRLSRSVHDFTGLIATAKREGWSLVVLDLALDMSTPNGKFMASVLASVSELERDLISARTSAALAQLKANGKRLGRPRTMPESVTERIVREREQGRTFAAIADALNADGVPTARGGARWYRSTVKAVLESAALDLAASA